MLVKPTISLVFSSHLFENCDVVMAIKYANVKVKINKILSSGSTRGYVSRSVHLVLNTLFAITQIEFIKVRQL